MTENQDQARIAEAQAAQARMLAALPDFPQFGFYVHTGLAGYGPDLEDGDYPARSWEDVASQVAWELRSAADFSHEGARVVAAADLYHEAWTALRLSWELDNLAANFENLANAESPAPLYQGRPELRHARIWDLLTSQFPLNISHNSRLYVFECEEDPGEEPE